MKCSPITKQLHVALCAVMTFRSVFLKQDDKTVLMCTTTFLCVCLSINQTQTNNLFLYFVATCSRRPQA